MASRANGVTVSGTEYNGGVLNEDSLRQSVAKLNRVRAEIAKVIVGQQEVIDGVLICLLSGGHVLLEGVPGLGKTTLLRTLSRVLHLKYSRIQFTPDLMPGDIVGSMMIETDDRGSKGMRFQPGPIFAHLLLADEINRATPKTQSALLEAMQERRVTIGNNSFHLPAPFLVIATVYAGSHSVSCARTTPMGNSYVCGSSDDVEPGRGIPREYLESECVFRLRDQHSSSEQGSR